MRIVTRLFLATVVLALVAVWSLVLLNWRDGGGEESRAGDGADSSGGGPRPSRSAGTDQGILRALPSVAQPGTTPARADAVGSVLFVRFSREQSHAVALLERQVDDAWQVVTSARLDRSGTATFTDVKPAPGNKETLYRATVLKPDGSRGLTTNGTRLGQWSLAFGDQFDGSTLDSSKWAYRMLGAYNENGSRVCSKSDERAVSVSGGTLRLQVIEDPERQAESCVTPKDGTLDYYLNGHISTEEHFDFKHGVAAARIKFPQSRGQHGAFWMQPSGTPTRIPGKPGKSGAEVDVAEYFGDDYPEGGLASFLYYLNSHNESEKVGGVWPKATAALPPGDDWWRSYHVFSVEWTPKQYIFRVDGRETFRTKEGVSGVPEYLILSLLTSDWELPKLDKSTLPSTMDVDWVRVWQKQPAAQ